MNTFDAEVVRRLYDLLKTTPRMIPSDEMDRINTDSVCLVFSREKYNELHELINEIERIHQVPF